jgi:hypothetical protein
MTAGRPNEGESIGGHPIGHPDSTMVLYADGVEAVVHVNHLSWALGDPMAASDNAEWMLLKLNILKSEVVPAVAAQGLRDHLEEHTAVVAEAAVTAERSVAASVRSGPHQEVPAFAAAYSAHQFCLSAVAWFDEAIAAGGSLHLGWIIRSAPDAPRLVCDEAALLRRAVPS